MKIQPKFLRLTEELNALDFFEKAVAFLRETDTSDVAWKWVVIGLHGAMYGFTVRQTSPTATRLRQIHSRPRG